MQRKIGKGIAMFSIWGGTAGILYVFAPFGVFNGGAHSLAIVIAFILTVTVGDI